MYGSATLAMVVSSACIMVANITHKVMIARCWPPSALAMAQSPTERLRLSTRPASERLWPVSTSTFALMPDRRGGASAGNFNLEPYGHALHHLDPIPGRILRRQHGELS